MVPTLRLMSAFAWQVVEQCNVMHYGKVEELVQLVTEVVPHLLSDREKVDLLLALRTKVRWTDRYTRATKDLRPQMEQRPLFWSVRTVWRVCA